MYPQCCVRLAVSDFVSGVPSSCPAHGPSQGGAPGPRLLSHVNGGIQNFNNNSGSIAPNKFSFSPERVI